MVSCAPNDQTPTAEEARLLAGYSTKNQPALLAGLRDPDPDFRALVRKMMELRPEERPAVIRALEEELEKKPMTSTSVQDICSTLHIECDFEIFDPSPDDDRTYVAGSLRSSDAQYSLVLNRHAGRWNVQLCSVDLLYGGDREHSILFDADDQLDLAVLSQAFQTLVDREERDAA